MGEMKRVVQVLETKSIVGLDMMWQADSSKLGHPPLLQSRLTFLRCADRSAEFGFRN